MNRISVNTAASHVFHVCILAVLFTFFFLLFSPVSLCSGVSMFDIFMKMSLPLPDEYFTYREYGTRSPQIRENEPDIKGG